jgi:hypothetical protein
MGRVVIQLIGEYKDDPITYPKATAIIQSQCLVVSVYEVGAFPDYTKTPDAVIHFPLQNVLQWTVFPKEI